jgi:hypothetical protein
LLYRPSRAAAKRGYQSPAEGSETPTTGTKRPSTEDALALERAGVKPREGDAQKALRRSYITSALICGRNPKLVAPEVGHTTTRMVSDTYDSFIDPANWPDAEEREHLAQIFGWDGDEIVGSNSHATHALRKAR